MTIYTRNPETNKFELAGPGGATTDTTLSQAGKPADSAAVGSALTNYATTASVSAQMNNKVDKVSGKGLSTNDFTAAYKSGLDDLMSQTHNMFSSLKEIGITTFPTTMRAVDNAMPANSMIVIDTRRVNGSGTEYGTETISDWGNSTNGMALIMKGATTARVTMMILYGSSEADHGDFTMGNYAVNTNTVNWTTLESKLDTKVDKNTKLSAVDLNAVTEPGLYYVSSGTTDLHFPAGSNGHMLVMSDGDRIRQVFFRVGTIDVNSFQWYSRNRSSVLTDGLDADGWSQWWLLSGSEVAWSGTAKLNAEINLGSIYGCQAWVISGQPTKTDTFSTIYIPRYYLTTDTTKWKLQIADETGYVSFYFYYKESDNNAYAKVVWVSDTTNSALRYVYRVS